MGFSRIMRIFIILNLLMLSLSVNAQQSGRINYEFLGLSFDIPQGWIGNETESGFVMGSNNEAGMILMTTHEEKSVAQLTAIAQQGISEGLTQLQASKSIDTINPNAIGVEMKGYLEGQSVIGYVAGVINPYGQGVTIMSMTTPEKYSNRYQELVLEVINSLSFVKPKVSAQVAQLKQLFTSHKLTYMNSNYSSGASVGGYSTYSGYSTNIEYNLCANGYFSRSGSSSMSIDTGGAFANGGGNSSDQGQWKITQNAHGGGELQFIYQDGSYETFNVSLENGKTYLNGTRYFRTPDAGC